LNPREIPGTATLGHIIYDGCNLTLGQGTGIATYTRTLTRIAQSLGYEIGVVYGSSFNPDKNPLLQEILFFDQMRAPNQLGKKPTPRRVLNTIIDQIRYQFPIKPSPLELGRSVIKDQYADAFAAHDHAFIERNLFRNANLFFTHTGRFANFSFERRPDIFHCTCVVPLEARARYNIYTIHDLIPLRLPFATLDGKRRTFRLLKKIAKRADHIVTVSETSRQDIIEMLGVEEQRVTNTYQSVTVPQRYIDRPEAEIANYLDGLYGLNLHGYLLFFGALEPKKNVGRLIDAYVASGVEIPLVLITAGGWGNEAELSRLDAHRARSSDRERTRSQIIQIDYLDLSALVNFIRGARAVVFPSLYEGFGLPVLEAMTLGTAVVTSGSGALAEIAGDAVLVVDPYDVDDIARGITTIVGDAGLRAELSRRGIAQAAKFSMPRYAERVQALYASLR
jgi:glycosyltransferase involved in cell wall biosynthesis